MFAWIAANQHELLVNFAAGVPFLFIDLIVITVFLPVAIEQWQSLWSRRVRRFAHQAVAMDYQDACQQVLEAVAATDRSRAAERRALKAEFISIRSRLAEEIPIYIQTLDANSRFKVLSLHTSFGRFMNDYEEVCLSPTRHFYMTDLLDEFLLSLADFRMEGLSLPRASEDRRVHAVHVYSSLRKLREKFAELTPEEHLKALPDRWPLHGARRRRWKVHHHYGDWRG